MPALLVEGVLDGCGGELEVDRGADLLVAVKLLELREVELRPLDRKSVV